MFTINCSGKHNWKKECRDLPDAAYVRQVRILNASDATFPKLEEFIRNYSKNLTSLFFDGTLSPENLEKLTELIIQIPRLRELEIPKLVCSRRELGLPCMLRALLSRRWEYLSLNPWACGSAEELREVCAEHIDIPLRHDVPIPAPFVSFIQSDEVSEFPEEFSCAPWMRGVGVMSVYAAPLWLVHALRRCGTVQTLEFFTLRLSAELGAATRLLNLRALFVSQPLEASVIESFLREAATPHLARLGVFLNRSDTVRLESLGEFIADTRVVDLKVEFWRLTSEDILSFLEQLSRSASIKRLRFGQMLSGYASLYASAPLARLLDEFHLGMYFHEFSEIRFADFTTINNRLVFFDFFKKIRVTEETLAVAWGTVRASRFAREAQKIGTKIFVFGEACATGTPNPFSTGAMHSQPHSRA